MIDGFLFSPYTAESHMRKVTCFKCKGTGKIKMSMKLSETMKRFTHASTRLTSLDLAEGEESTVTAFNNRLEELRALGFLDRQRNGRLWEYFRKPANRNKAGKL